MHREPVIYSEFAVDHFDGTLLTSGPETAIHEHVDASGRLWLLGGDLLVTRITPPSTVEVLGAAPTGASAIATDGTDLYIGTSSSELYRATGL
jgi:hypothetical protein